MSLFLAVKQIVDVLYEFRTLDYAMVILAIGMILYGFFKYKAHEGFRNKICFCDFAVAALGVLYLFSFLRDTSATSQFLKTESAFLVYFLGRMFGGTFADAFGKEKGKKQEICLKILTVVSYVIIYANFAYKLYVQITWKLKKIYVGEPEFNIHSDGALYYYKTDMAIGIIVAIIFVYVLGKQAVLKWLTIVPVGIYMLFYETQAKSGQIILILEYLLILSAELYRRGILRKIHTLSAGRKKPADRRRGSTGSTLEPADAQTESKAESLAPAAKRQSSFALLKVIVPILFVGLTIFFVFIQCFSPLKVNLEDLGLAKEQMRKLESIFHSRHLIWWDAISYFVQQPLGTRLVGIDLVSETAHNSLGDRFHNLYFKQIYSIGYLGCYLYTAVLCVLWKVLCTASGRQNVLRFLGAAFWIMFLIMSISMEGLEYTQMSWYPFILLGVLVTVDKSEELQGKAARQTTE